MKTLKLITNDPLQLYSKSINGFPATYKLIDGADAPVPPEGWAYVEELGYPPEDAQEGSSGFGILPLSLMDGLSRMHQNKSQSGMSYQLGESEQ